MKNGKRPKPSKRSSESMYETQAEGLQRQQSGEYMNDALNWQQKNRTTLVRDTMQLAILIGEARASFRRQPRPVAVRPLPPSSRPRRP